MSILKRIFNRFSNKKIISAELNETPPVESSKTANKSIFTYSIYETGFSNGVLKIQPDEDSFHRFLRQTREVERLEEVRNMRQVELANLEAQLQNEKQTVLEKRQSLSVVNNQLQLTEYKISVTSNKKQAKESKASVLSKSRDEIKAEYAWVPAILYMIAGIVFIVSDVEITKDITSNGFDMDEREALIFALGLACTAFLLKPFIDRMLEKSFQKNGFSLNSFYKIFLLVIALSGLMMLYLLGDFRSAAQQYSNNKKVLTEEYVNASRLGNEVLMQQNKEALRELGQKLGESKSGHIGIVLSGIMFAIGGGLCLAIAFPSLTGLTNRYYILPFRIARLKSGIQKGQIALDKLHAKKFEQSGIISSIKDHLEFLDYDTLLPSIKEIRLEIETITDAIYAEKGLTDQYFYLSAKERGYKYELDGDLKFTVKRNSLAREDQMSEDGTIDSTKRKYARRPYIKLRKILADTYNKNKNGY